MDLEVPGETVLSVYNSYTIPTVIYKDKRDRLERKMTVRDYETQS